MKKIVVFAPKIFIGGGLFQLYEIINDLKARLIRDGNVIYNGKISSIYREKNQAKQVNAGLECGITLKDFSDYKKKDIIEVFDSTVTERTI